MDTDYKHHSTLKVSHSQKKCSLKLKFGKVQELPKPGGPRQAEMKGRRQRYGLRQSTLPLIMVWDLALHNADTQN